MDTTSTLLKTKLEEVSSFFNNPFSTPIGQMIDSATTPTPQITPTTPNYSLLLEICDLLNNTNDPAVFTNLQKCIRKKLQSRNHNVLDLTLILVEVTVKNCAAENERFRGAVLGKEVVAELGRCNGGTPPSTSTQDRTLSLIQTLHFTFPSNEVVTAVYEELREKGVEYPSTDLDSMVPIVFKTKPKPVQQHPQLPPEESDPILHPVHFTTTQIKPSPEQKLKIRGDLNVVVGNLAVLNEVLSEGVVGGAEEEAWLELLYTTCVEMQSRLGRLLGQIDPEGGGEELVSELLAVNDELNNGFLRYTRHVKNKQKKANPGGAVSVPMQKVPQPINQSSAAELIDFSVEPTAASGAIPKKNREQMENEEIIDDQEASFIIQGRQQQQQSQPPMVPQPPPNNTTLSSSEFDRFLEERARK